MIISFNPSVFLEENSELHPILAEILIALMRTSVHFLDMKNVLPILYDESEKYILDSNPISHYLSPKQKTELKELSRKKSLKNITKLHRKYLTNIIIGLEKDSNEIHPKDAHRIIKERSKIIVENGINDWKFIQGICQKYSGCKTDRRSIYCLLDKAIKEEYIEPENCGGVGELVKVVDRWISNERYKSIFKYKLMAVFDSDRASSQEIDERKNSIIKYLKRRSDSSGDCNISDCNYETEDLIVWHILYKRKIENYVPLSILFKCISSVTQSHVDELNSKSNEELDFMEYEKSNIGIGENRIKSQFPEMFLADFSYRDFEEKCKHHNVFVEEVNGFVSEIEQILLKVAKIL